MPQTGCYGFGDVSVAVWAITETEGELLAMLPAEYSCTLAGVVGNGRRLEWLAVRALLVSLFGPHERIVYDGAGKPSLASGKCRISISHTDGYALLAYGGSPFGVDVELVDRNLLPLARRVLRDDEAWIATAECANEMLLMRWCVSESLFKLVGNLGGTFRDNILMESAPLSCSGSIAVSLTGVRSGYGDGFVAEYRKVDGLLVVVCRPALRF